MSWSDYIMHTQIYYNRLCDRTIDGTALHPTPPAAPLAGRHPPADTPASRPKTAGTADLKAGWPFLFPASTAGPKLLVHLLRTSRVVGCGKV